VQFGHGQHIGFGHFTTPACHFWTALSKRLKKNGTQVKSLFIGWLWEIRFWQDLSSKPAG
jgi:hypothetical protein